ncbi:MAG TPA: bifunctional diaminohydroxyphosphoribosylaminopyrimidine deaminase/5-amino-6-(5-phosphoribosylamino)uracil reductase RibD [Tepidimicrobium sp.]|nr:bifunctional diaminohydroxyphosphoribosylaminopyrimidine deaminase/5-amino-6-(5-phosphoribosylamino)uracil reductase RibD [Tepidimicrobium sp.]
MNDQYFMRIALELAKRGAGFVNPNPMVGAIIVRDERIIGEGYHESYGADHAEINALNNAIEDVEGATMYVTLEPCSHHGKTPPCALKIANSGISRVVIAMEDPNKLVSGSGIKILKDKGLQVEVGILRKEAEKLNEIFLKYITKRIPFTIMKAGMSLDGKIATHTGDSKWITGIEARRYAHVLRQGVSGILVGVNTIIMDDPMLNTRLKDQKTKDPIRIILDSHGRTPLESRVLNKNPANTIIVVTNSAPRENIEAFYKKGAEVMMVPSKDGKVDLQSLMVNLGKNGIDSVLIEGGGEVNFSFLDENLVDKVVFFIAPKIIGGRKAKTPVEGKGMPLIGDVVKLQRVKFMNIGEDIMIEGYINRM